MYLDRLRVRSLKLLKDFELGFTHEDGSPRMWTAIIGRNGTAKTSILQAIALSAAGSKQVNRVASGVVGHLRDRRGRDRLEIEADYQFSQQGRLQTWHRHAPTEMISRAGRDADKLLSTIRLRSRVTLDNKQTTLDASAEYLPSQLALKTGRRADPLDAARAANVAHWFVAGYGISRFLPDPSASPQLTQPSIERLEPLFNNRTTLTSLRFIDYFSKAKRTGFSKALRDALANVHDLIPGLSTIELRGRGGVRAAGDLMERDRLEFKIGPKAHKFPAVALSHGYQSTIAWIADLIGHVMLEASEPIAAAQIEGVVLVDEIDLYLHPTWQATLIGALRRIFPKVQFVVTTHSPVVLASLSPEEIVVVDHNPETGNVERFVHDASGRLVPQAPGSQALGGAPDPRAMTGTDLYRQWFDLDRLTLNPQGAKLREYLSLATDPLRTDEEDERTRKLEHELSRVGIHPLRDPVDRQESAEGGTEAGFEDGADDT